MAALLSPWDACLCIDPVINLHLSNLISKGSSIFVIRLICVFALWRN